MFSFAQILRQYPAIALNDYIHQVTDVHPVHGKPKGQEERDRLYARVFAYAALVRSERIKFAFESLTKSAYADITRQVVAPLIDDLFSLANKKFFVTEMCFYILCTLIQTQQIPLAEFTAQTLPLFIAKLDVDPETHFSPEQLWLLIQMNHAYGVDWSQHLPRFWKSGPVVQSVHLRQIKPALAAAVYTTPKLHSIWQLVLRDVFAAENSTVLLQDFWTTVVDDLFASSQSAQLMAMQILENVFPHLQSAEQVAFVFTRNCLRTLTNALQFRNHHLHKPARRFLAVIDREAKKSPIVAVAVVTALQGNSVGSKSFDQRTGTRVVHSLLGLMDSDSAKKYISNLVAEFYKPSEEFKQALVQEQAAAIARRESNKKNSKQNKKSSVRVRDADSMDVDESDAEDAAEPEAPEIDEDVVDLQQLIDGRRHWVLNQLFAIAKGGGPVSEKEDEIIAPLLRFFFFHAFFTFTGETAAATTPSKKNKQPKQPELLQVRQQLEPPLSEASRKLCQDRLYSLLGQFSSPQAPSTSAPAQEASKKASKTAPEVWVHDLLDYQLQVLEKEPNLFEALNPLVPREDGVEEDDSDEEEENKNAERGAELLKVRADALQLVGKIKAKRLQFEKKEASEEVPRLRAFELLFLHLLLQLNVDPAEAAQNLTELSQGYRDVFEKTASKKKSTPSKKKKGALEEEEASGPIEIMTDVRGAYLESVFWQLAELHGFSQILVGLLLKPSAILRDIVENAFKTVVCDQITSSALKVLLNAVKENAAALLVGEGEGEDGEELNASDLDSDEMDAVMAEFAGGSGSGDEASEEEGAATDASEDEENINIPPPKSKKSPSKKNADASASSAEESDSDDNEPGMTDAQMFAMDKHIAAVLKLQKENRRSQRDTQQQLLHFKFRVLDLLDIFLKRQSDNVLIFDTIRPLLDALQDASKAKEQAALLQRIASTFNTKLCKLKTYPRGESVNVPTLIELVGDLLLKATKTKLGILADSCCQAIQFLLRVIAGQHTPADTSSVAEKLTNALKSFTRNHNSHLRPAFFQDLLQKQPSLGWALFPGLVDVLENSRPGFTRVQVFGLYNTIITKKQLESADLKKKFVKFAPTIRRALMCCLNDSKIKANQMKQVLRTAAQIFKQIVAVFGGDSTSALEQARNLWDHQPLIQTLSGLYGEFFQRSPPLARQCEQLISQISGQTVKIQASPAAPAAAQNDQQNPKKRKSDGATRTETEPVSKKSKIVKPQKKTGPQKHADSDSSEE